MLSASRIEQILGRLPMIAIGVVGDLFLDQYLRLDCGLTEPSLETGLDAYQVVEVINSPGAAGTVLNNLAALGVGTVKILSFIGTDGRGYDLKQELIKRKIDLSYLLETPLRHTPTYTKPMLSISPIPSSPSGGDGRVKGWAEMTFRELNRFDIKNRTQTPVEVEHFFVESLPKLWQEVDALIVLDQVSESNCGVITADVRYKLAELGQANPSKLLLADSREQIGLFRNCWTKPNAKECLQAAVEGGRTDSGWDLDCDILWLLDQTKRPVFCTLGGDGIYLVDPFHPRGRAYISTFLVGQTFNEKGQLLSSTSTPVEEDLPSINTIPGYPVSDPIDPVGAGDSTSAGIACAYAAGASLVEAAAFGNLIASITVQQLGTTGIATPELVRARWKEVST